MSVMLKAVTFLISLLNFLTVYTVQLILHPTKRCGKKT